MLQLTTSSQLLTARVYAKIARFKNSIITSLIVVLGCLLIGSANAQDITMPTVEIEGIDENTDGANILITVFKYIARIVLWILMVVAGFLAGKTILKSWNEQKTNDQGKWGAVIGDSAGSVIMVIFVIAVCTWLLTFLS